MKARDYRLVVDGKYNRRAIMQRSWAYMKQNKAYMKQNKAFKWYSFAKALKDAWVDASLKMDEYKAQVSPVYTDYPKPANNFRQALIDLNPALRCYDSSWR